MTPITLYYPRGSFGQGFNMKNRQLTVILLALAWFAPTVFAVSVSNQFETKLPANSQTDTERATLVRQGLKQVLASIIGRERILQNKKIKSALNKADHYVQEYRYHSSTASGSAKYLLIIRYNKQAVTTLLEQAGYKIKAAPEATHWFKLHVSPMLKSKDVDELIASLKQLERVLQVDLSLLSGEMVEVVVLAHGSQEDFQQAVTAVKRLALKSQEPTDNTLIYEWSHKAD